MHRDRPRHRPRRRLEVDGSGGAADPGGRRPGCNDLRATPVRLPSRGRPGWRTVRTARWLRAGSSAL